MKIRPFIALAIALATSLCATAQLHPIPPSFHADGLQYINAETRWVDSVMATMGLERRIAQLMIVRVPQKMDDKQAAAFADEVERLGVGGVCFFAGTAERQASITRRLRQGASLPLWVSIDGEWGLGMRMKEQFSFPRAARFGSLTPDADSIVYRMGQAIGRQCRKMGININFAPVVDINSNPKNPVIGTRSFGTDPARVADLGIMYARGQQSEGVMAVAKHFPGHGDTDADSHKELPVIRHTPAYIDTVDLYPFKRMIAAGVGGIMVAHLQVLAIDPDRPSSLSPAVVTSLLRHRLGFDGLVITDGLDMKGVTNTYGNGSAALAALMAGNDLLLLPPDVEQAIAAIRTAAVQSDSVRQQIDYHLRRVLRAKYRWVVPYQRDPITLPDDEDRKLCQDIVHDLDLNTDRSIDSIVDRGIKAHAMPGCQIVVMHKGRVVMDRAYGRQTYDSLSPAVTPQTVYDLASLTKVTATTLAMMKLVDDGKVKIDDKLSRYLPYLKGTNKANITIKQAMSHQARLKAFDSYWQRTSDRDSLLLLVANSPLNADDAYCYSDLGFILLSDLVLRVTGKPLDRYVDEQFYVPMGLTSTTFNPLAEGYNPADIAPTEVDSLRGGLIRGTVHDPNAYAMGGVSGHAGLFSNAREVAILMQMLLNGGTLDGHRYLKAKTIETFTSRHFEARRNRRALGFDKQLFTPSANGQAALEATQSSYGHTGFTGTMLWVDPEYDLVYVFLSNRVHPSATPNKLAQMNIRTDIQSRIYSILKQQ